MSQEVSKTSFEMGAVIFKQGDSDTHFYIIDEGRVGIFITQNGKTIKISECGPGESFGEFALLSGAPRSASAQALTPVKAFKVSAQGFDELLTELPEWASCMLKSFVSRMKSMNERLKELPQFISQK